MAKKQTEDDEKPQARLFDMRVGEVSLVDRAANRRRFIMTKRDDMTRLQADGRGGFIEVEIDKGDDKSGDSDAKNTGETNPTETTEPDATAKGSDADKGCNGKGKKSDKGDDDKGKGDDDEAKKGVAKSVSMFGAIAQRVIDVAKALEGGTAIPESFDEEVAIMVGEAMKAARMTPSRKDRFAAALGSLQKILAELSGAAAADAKKAEGDRFDQLQGEIAKLTQTVKSQGDTISKQADTIRQLETQPAGSNALPVEGGNDSGGGDDDVVWPLDMNAESKIDKAAAEKRGTSFYD